MDRDTFWENICDFLKLATKVIVVMVALQIIFIVTGSDMKIPYVHSGMMQFLRWVKETFGSYRFGM